MWTTKVKVIPVVTRAARRLSRSFQKHVENVCGKHSRAKLQKAAILETVRILRKILTGNVINYVISPGS
jgi:hypothetical protein